MPEILEKNKLYRIETFDRIVIVLAPNVTAAKSHTYQNHVHFSGTVEEIDFDDPRTPNIVYDTKQEDFIHIDDADDHCSECNG